MKAWTPIVTVIWLSLSVCTSTTFGQTTEIENIYFETQNGLMLVQATLDNQSGTFILDTGSPTLVLNDRHFTGKSSDWRANGLNGKVAVQEFCVKKWRWGQINRRNFKAVVANLQHLEQALQRPILGLIGYEMIRKHELYFDYKNRIIRQYNAKRSVLHESAVPSAVIPFDLKYHLPVVQVVIGEKLFRFGLDSGAETNVLHLQKASQLTEDAFHNIRTVSVQDLGSHVKRTTAAIVKCTLIEENRFVDMKYVFADLSSLRQAYNLSIDGLLGFPFWSAHKVSINYRKQELYFWNVPEQYQFIAQLEKRKI